MLSSELVNRGSLQYTTIANPAAGTDFQWAVPIGERVEIVAVRFTLVTSAAVANRYATLTIQEPAGTAIYRCAPQIVQTASQTRIYYASQCNNAMPVAYTDAEQLALPPRNTIRTLWTLNSAIGLMDVADQISAIHLVYLRQVLPA